MNKSILPVLVLLSLMFTVLYSCKSDTGKTASTQKENTANQTSKESASPKENNSPSTDNSAASKEVKLSADEQKKLNIFFSNFSEVYLNPFTKESITDNDLINFGVLHLYKNNNKLFEKADNSNSKVKDEHVSASIRKYFGRDVSKHQSTSDFKYKSGYYFIPQADGEAYTFSQVERLIDIGNDRYTAYINVYTASSGWTGNAHASPKDWKNSDGDEKPELTEKFKAVFIKNNGPKGESVYTLVDYLKQ